MQIVSTLQIKNILLYFQNYAFFHAMLNWVGLEYILNSLGLFLVSERAIHTSLLGMIAVGFFFKMLVSFSYLLEFFFSSMFWIISVQPLKQSYWLCFTVCSISSFVWFLKLCSSVTNTSWLWYGNYKISLDSIWYYFVLEFCICSWKTLAIYFYFL